MSERTKDLDVATSCQVERLQKEALECLEKFPNKVTDLNNIIEIYAPPSVKNGNIDDTINKFPGSISSINEDDNESPDEIPVKLDKSQFDLRSLTSYYTLTTYNDRGFTRNGTGVGGGGVCKRRYYRVRGPHHLRTLNRRRPAALGQLIGFIASKLAVCTKNIIITPSSYIVERIISTLFRRRELKNAQCGPCADWSSSLSACATTLKDDTTTVGRFISVIRPAAVQLITDTTILKRWLQSLATKNITSVELANATRNTETIDCWAYELFFHLKHLQVNRAREKIADSGMTDDVTHLNLWHRMVQLRDNYIILYEILYADPKIRGIQKS
ncbi:uncharacterized protein LOC130674356 [Microplitis mediator]|uniref:uncharacterized protein LOC130674356 n=1 Tax=Microplitis mediator TaxID=375433 RepID=UPI0025535739|nr:uncharacterized protein LOC130674356 [Microplitis mediator]